MGVRNKSEPVVSAGTFIFCYMEIACPSRQT
jgi:hypothetical protein